MNELARLTQLAQSGDLDNREHAELYGMRMKGDRNANALLAPYEHQAYAREYVENNPFSGPLAMAILTAGYTPAKALGLTDTDEKSTPASLDQMLGGFKGIGQGISSNLRGFFGR